MMGLDTTFLVQLEIQEAEAHDAALEVLHGKILGRDREAALVPQVLSEFVHAADLHLDSPFKGIRAVCPATAPSQRPRNEHR